MRNFPASTALALALGFGVVGVDPAPYTSDGIAMAQAGDGGSGGRERRRERDDSDESGAVHPLEPSPARAWFVQQCDRDGDGFVSTDEAVACAGQRGYVSGAGSRPSRDRDRD